MRLLKTSSGIGDNGKLELIERWGTAIPSYAILSHTWSQNAEDEVIFADVQNGSSHRKPAFAKVQQALERARLDGYDYLWIDTCCIDKTSSTELSEAINSMYRYYRDAVVCYVYLADVHESIQDLRASRWFSRGWTLQELIAPTHLQFFSSSWRSLGRKEDLAPLVSEITGIDRPYLLHQEPVHSASVAKRMSWAAERHTTREEDIVYSLMGLFDVNMPMLYGEGQSRAFLRLQDEIMRTREDHSIFAWADATKPQDGDCGMLADSPSCFKHSGEINACMARPGAPIPTLTARGLHITLPLRRQRDGTLLAILNCTIRKDGRQLWIAIYLSSVASAGSSRQFARVRPHDLVSCPSGQSDTANDRSKPDQSEIYVRRTHDPNAPAQYPVRCFQLHAAKCVGTNSHLRQYKLQGACEKYQRTEPPIIIPELSGPIFCRHLGNTYVVSKTESGSAAALGFTSKGSTGRFVLILGLLPDMTPGFEAVEAKRVGSSNLVAHLERPFSPKAMGEKFHMPAQTVAAFVEEKIQDGMKAYLVTIAIEPHLSTDEAKEQGHKNPSDVLSNPSSSVPDESIGGKVRWYRRLLKV